MNIPILYSYRRCPYAIRARMALKLADIAVEIREISLREKPKHMLQVSPKGTVPVLVLVDGTVIDESLAIMLWCMQQADLKLVALKQTALKYEGEYDALQVNIHAGCKALVLINDTDFKKNLDAYKYPERYLQHGIQLDLQPNLHLEHAKLKLQIQLKYRTQGEVFLAHLESLLQKNTYLFANTSNFANSLSFADIAIFPFIRQFAMVDSAWFENSNYPKLRAWLHNWIDSSLFKSVMTKNPTFIG